MARACRQYSTQPTYVESNMGPRYSNIGAARHCVKRSAKSQLIVAADTISAYADGGIFKNWRSGAYEGQAFPDRGLPQSRTPQLDNIPAGAGCRRRRRRDPPSLHSRKAALRRPSCKRPSPGPGRRGRPEDCCDTEIANELHGRSSSAVRTARSHQPGVRQHLGEHPTRSSCTPRSREYAPVPVPL